LVAAAAEKLVLLVYHGVTFLLGAAGPVLLRMAKAGFFRA